MQFNNRGKYNYIIASAFAALIVWHSFLPKKKLDEIIVNNIHIDRKPCIGAMNYLLGTGADSLEICNCLIPAFYNLIKDSPALVDKFRDSPGFFTLQGTFQDSFISISSKCIREHILDTNYMFKFRPQDEQSLMDGVRKKIGDRILINNLNADRMISCIVERINGHITIKQYFSKEYFDSPEFEKIFSDCEKEATEVK